MNPGLTLGRTVVVCAALVSGAAQPVAEPPQVLSIETDLVVLPVTVVDQHGRVVTGLTRGDFTVYDNGERQEIQLFTTEEVPWTVGLVIDSSSSMRGQRDTVTAAGVAFAEWSHPLDELFTVNFNEAAWRGLHASHVPLMRAGARAENKD